PVVSIITSPFLSHFSTLTLHDALPIYFLGALYVRHERAALAVAYNLFLRTAHVYVDDFKSVEAFFFQRRDKRVRLPSEKLSGYEDRKSTRLNSSHVSISYAVFCLNNKR